MNAKPEQKESTVELPKSVRVGYATYRIENWPPELASASGLHGECDRLNHIIRIRTDIVSSELANTLLHEILHAAYHAGAADNAEEEKLVTTLANQLTQVFRDNPEVMDWISKQARA